MILQLESQESVAVALGELGATLLLQVARQRGEGVAVVLIHREDLVERLERRAHVAGRVQADRIRVEKAKVGRRERGGALQLRQRRGLPAESQQSEADTIVRRRVAPAQT